MLKRWLKLLGKILLALIALFVGFLLFERFRGQIALANYKRELAARGEKLTPQELATTFSVDDNGAPAVMKNIRLLQDGAVLPKRYPPRMKLTPAGRAIVCFKEDEWVDDKVTNRWEQVALDLKRNENFLREIQGGLSEPILNNNLDYAAGMKMQFLHLSPAKTATYWFGAAAQLALHEGRPHEALPYLLTQIGLPRLLADDRITISELVRIAIAAIARTDTWEALQAEGWSDDDLAALQAAWSKQDFATAMARSLEGERIFDDVSQAMIRESNQDAASAFFGLAKFMGEDWTDRPRWERTLRALPAGDQMTDFLQEQIYCRIWRFAWSHQDQHRGLEQMQRLIEIARAAAKDRSALPARDGVEELIFQTADPNIYDRLRFPNIAVISLSRMVAKAMRAETDRSLAISAIALKRCSLRHGEYPSTLKALAPEFFLTVPVDYMDGKPIKYKLQPDGSFMLYSVGEDGKDDGGDSSLVPDAEAPHNYKQRRDYLWPAPARPEEVEAYRKTSADQ